MFDVIRHIFIIPLQSQRNSNGENANEAQINMEFVTVLLHNLYQYNCIICIIIYACWPVLLMITSDGNTNGQWIVIYVSMLYHNAVLLFEIIHTLSVMSEYTK